MKIYIKRKAFGDNLLFSDFSLSIKEGKTSFLMAPWKYSSFSGKQIGGGYICHLQSIGFRPV